MQWVHSFRRERQLQDAYSQAAEDVGQRAGLECRIRPKAAEAVYVVCVRHKQRRHFVEGPWLAAATVVGRCPQGLCSDVVTLVAQRLGSVPLCGPLDAVVRKGVAAGLARGVAAAATAVLLSGVLISTTTWLRGECTVVPRRTQTASSDAVHGRERERDDDIHGVGHRHQLSLSGPLPKDGEGVR